MNKQRDTQGKPNLTERFLYHTAIGRWYNDFDVESKHIIRFVVAAGLVSFGVTIYLVITVLS